MKTENNPAASRDMKVEQAEFNGERALRVSFSLRNAACLFLMLWLTGWTFACGALVSKIASGPFAIGELLFALPFLAAEVAVACIVVVMLFGHTAIVISKHGGSRFTGIGSLGYTKTFAFPEDGEIGTDETVSYAGKGGPRTIHRLVVKTRQGADDPIVIYTSQNPGRIGSLFKAAGEFFGASAAPAGVQRAEAAYEAESAEAAAAEADRNDRALLAGNPPDGVSVVRDFEGRLFVTLRRVGWGTALFVAFAASVVATILWANRAQIPQSAYLPIGIGAMVPLAFLVSALFGKRTLTLDHGEGVAFAGVGGIGVRRRFSYGGQVEVALADANLVVNGAHMREIVLTQTDGRSVKLCTTWPNDVKPYLAALIRHPESVAAMPMMPAI